MHAGHVYAESIVMAFKQESHCLHKSSGSEEEEVWLHVLLLHQNAPTSKKHITWGLFLQSSYLFDVYLAGSWSNRKERRQLEGLAKRLLSTIKQISGHVK